MTRRLGTRPEVSSQDIPQIFPKTSDLQNLSFPVVTGKSEDTSGIEKTLFELRLKFSLQQVIILYKVVN